MPNPFLHPNRAHKHKHKGHPERDLQIKCVEWFRKTHKNSVLVQIPNEACFNRASEFKETGMLKGASDIFVIHRGQVVFVEFKAEDGKQSREQRAFELKVKRQGLKYLIIKDLESFKNEFV